MTEAPVKLRPDRDLQVYFERPSAIAALSGAGEGGFTLSGTWRQQFDWAVVEWNRDNVIEPHFMRPLPDGDLSGLTLSYEEERLNCIPIDSDLYHTVDWDGLRIWTRQNGVDELFKVKLRPLATSVEGSYQCATATFTLIGTPTSGDYVGISLLDEHYTYQVLGSDTIQSIVEAIAGIVNQWSTYAKAIAVGPDVTLTYHGAGFTVVNSTIGANGNRIGAYGYVSGARTEEWMTTAVSFHGGMSPTRWKVTIPFGGLIADDGRTVPTQCVRKMRWTYAAELQSGAYERSEFEVAVSKWNVAGTGRSYSIPTKGSQRRENTDAKWVYQGTWYSTVGNFSGGSIHYTAMTGASARFSYIMYESHELALGTRYADSAALIQVVIDGQLISTQDLFVSEEDQLARVMLGQVSAGPHTVEVRHSGVNGRYLYIDFLDILSRTAAMESFPTEDTINVATDWDTDHSLAIPAERTAWLIQFLGFRGRVNHYVGALWYYELVRSGHVYASTVFQFIGVPVFGEVTTLVVGRDFYPPNTDLILIHQNRIGDTAETIAKSFELELNRGYTAIRGVAVGDQLTIYSRSMGEDGNSIHVSASPSTGAFQVKGVGDHLSGGVDGLWHTDVNAEPRLNRACRDWTRAFIRYLNSVGCEVTCAFSMELQHGDRSAAAGIAQRYPNGEAVYLNTPALQTNFSPASFMFWRDVYRGMADLMASEGVTPYLQFGEVQWWYFPLAESGMPYYDEYSMNRFANEWGRPMQLISSQLDDPAPYVTELTYLANLIGEFTSNVIAYVRLYHGNSKFEVLYPTDVNESSLNSIVNFPVLSWTPASLTCLKTESFTYTYAKNVNLGRYTVDFASGKGFPSSQQAFLCGIGDWTTSWKKEVAYAKSRKIESITLFALDQFCLIGYKVPLDVLHGKATEV